MQNTKTKPKERWDTQLYGNLYPNWQFQIVLVRLIIEHRCENDWQEDLKTDLNKIKMKWNAQCAMNKDELLPLDWKTMRKLWWKFRRQFEEWANNDFNALGLWLSSVIIVPVFAVALATYAERFVLKDIRVC